MKKPSFLKLHRGGFTMMELVLVMAVMTILVGIALPSLLAYHRNAQEIERNRHQELAAKSIRQYYAYRGGFPDLAGLEPDDGDMVLSDAQAAELSAALRDITTARVNTDLYRFTYNENTGSISLEIK